jgi:integrase/recombinase XerC
MSNLKQCSKCKEWKERSSSNFRHNKSRADGFSYLCKPCDAERDRNYQAPPEVRKRKLANNRRWYAKQPKRPKADGVARRGQKPPKPPKLPKVKLPKPPRKTRVVTPKPPKPPKPPLVLQPDLQQAITAFLNAKALKKEKTQKGYRSTLRLYGEHLVEAGLPHWPPDADTVGSFLAAAARRGCTDVTLDNYYRAIRTWLNWLIKRKRIEAGLIELIERPPRNRPLPKVANASDAVKLMTALTQAAPDSWRNTRDLALITLALDTGARIGELAALTLDRLNLYQRTISATHTKTGQDRTIVFSEQAAEPLARWREVRDALGLPDSLTAVFVGQPKGQPFGPLTDSGMRQLLRRRQRQAGIDHFNFHRLRHSYAVYTLRAGGDLLDVQKQLGHASLATTQIYCLVDDAGRGARHNTANPLAYLVGAL